MKKLYHQLKTHSTFRFAGKVYIKLGRESMDVNGKRRKFKDSDTVMLEK